MSTKHFLFHYISYRHQHEQVHGEYKTLIFFISHTGTSMNRYVVSTTLFNFSTSHTVTSMSRYIMSTTLIFLISQTDSCMNRWYMWVQQCCTFIMFHIDASKNRFIVRATLFYILFISHTDSIINRYIVSTILFLFLYITIRQQHEQINFDYKILSFSLYLI